MKLAKKSATPGEPSLYPKEREWDIMRLSNWYSSKMKPHTQHFFELVAGALKDLNGK